MKDEKEIVRLESDTKRLINWMGICGVIFLASIVLILPEITVALIGIEIGLFIAWMIKKSRLKKARCANG